MGIVACPKLANGSMVQSIWVHVSFIWLSVHFCISLFLLWLLSVAINFCDARPHDHTRSKFVNWSVLSSVNRTKVSWMISLVLELWKQYQRKVFLHLAETVGTHSSQHMDIIVWARGLQHYWACGHYWNLKNRQRVPSQNGGHGQLWNRCHGGWDITLYSFSKPSWVLIKHRAGWKCDNFVLWPKITTRASITHCNWLFAVSYRFCLFPVQ